MNVTREDVDALNARLTVAIKPEDYQEKVNKTLEQYKKTAKVPGFRPGHIPVSLIRKQYGKAILSEELNKIVNENLQKYIDEQKIEILGNPIPVESGTFEGDFENPSNFEFKFDIGLAPQVQIPLTGKSKFDYLKVKVDAKLIDQQIEDLTRRYGKLVSGEEVGEKDMVLAQFTELNSDESVKDGGIVHSSTVSVEFIENEQSKKLLLGKKVGEELVLNPAQVSKGGKDTAAMLGIKPDELESVSDKFRMLITDIKVMQVAEMNQDLFDKLFGEGVVTSEAELRERVKSDLAGMFSSDSDRMFVRDVYNYLMENVSISLPDAFLKRWIKMSNEKEITDEQIEAEYDGYAKGLKWQLIQGAIFKENNIQLGGDEVLNFTKGLIISNYAQYGIPAPEDQELTASAIKILQNKEEMNRIYDMLAEQKLMEYFKTTVSLNEKEIDYDSFVERVSK